VSVFWFGMHTRRRKCRAAIRACFRATVAAKASH
jgi:hypothetical protein